MNRRRGKPIFYTLCASVLIIAIFLYIKHTNPSTDTETIMVCLAIFTAVAFFLEYHQNSLLNEAQFVIDLNNQFLNEGNLANVEHDLEMYYNKKGFSANRKTVRDDVYMLCDAGYEILIDKDGKSNSYHFGTRTFELPELKMLVDAVSSSRFISAEKSEALIQKLTSLTSRYEAEDLTAKIFTADRIKADNGKIFLTTDVVSRAIEQEKKVSFQYYDYLPSKEKVLKNNGEVYIISPYALIWSDDRYYLVGYSDKRHELTPFRVDRMTVPQITDEPAIKNTSFNPADFTNKVVQMYPSGVEQTVTLRCKNETMRSVIDKFGEDITVDVIDREHFTAKVQVQLSPPLEMRT